MDKRLIEIYQAYMDELSDKYGLNITESAEDILLSFEEYCHEIIPVQDVGFIIVGRFPDCHPMCDRFICQAYIMPEHRRKGLMGKAMSEYIKQNPGKYCLDILWGNHVAEAFWDYVFEKEGYEQIILPDAKRNNITKCDTRYYAPIEA